MAPKLDTETDGTDTDGTEDDTSTTDGTDTTNAGDGAGDDDGDGEGDGTDALGDAGKKALDAMKSERNAARKLAREHKAELDRLKAERDDADKPDADKALSQARQEATKAATDAANKRILKSELRVAAKGKLADVSDAALYIDLDDFEVGDDGDVDADALSDAIDELIERKPHLAAERKPRFEGGADQGAQRKPAKPSQLSQQDLNSMSPAQIIEAAKLGRLDKITGKS